MTPSVIITLCAFLFVVVFFTCQKIPSTLTITIAVCALWLTGVLTMQEVFANFTGNAIIILVSMMIVSGGLMKTSILSHIINLTHRFKNGGERIIIFAALFLTFVLSNFINGVGALICLVPLLMGLEGNTSIPRTRLIQVSNAGALFGTSMFPVGLGVTTYIMKNQILENMGSDARFSLWGPCIARLIPVIFAMVWIVAIGYKLLPAKSARPVDDSYLGTQSVSRSTLTPVKETLAYLIFGLTVLGMMLSNIIQISAAMCSVLGAVLMCLCGILDEKECFQKVHWPTVFLLGFVLAFATALTKSGAGEFLGSVITTILGGSAGLRTVIAVYFIVTAIATQLMDNTAIINVMGPLAVATCISLDLNPLAVIGAIEVAGLTALATPMGSPSTAVSYNLGGYKISEMVKFSVPILVIMLAASVVILPLLWP